MFASRECKTLLHSTRHKLDLGYLSAAESQCFVNKELQDLPFQNSVTLIHDFVAIGHGLPYAVKLRGLRGSHHGL